MFQVLDSPGRSDSDENDVRDEECVDVEDMNHRNNQEFSVSSISSPDSACSSESGSSHAGHQSSDPQARGRLSRQPSRHVAKWHARNRGGLTKRCVKPVQD